MSSTILQRKPLTTVKGEKIVDLTYPSVRYNYDPTIISAIAVDPQMEMRPDIVSRVAYGTTDFWDLLLKYNGISNPFSIERNDLLLIPLLEDMREQLAPAGSQNVIADTVRKQYIDVSKKAKQDPKLAEAEKKRREAQRKKAENLGVQSTTNLPPNIAEEGDREIIIKGGKVFFGPDISRNKQECEVPLSKSEFLSKLIKNRIKTSQNG
jgi:hypothetical protein